ncbi:MAG TPA: DUF4199 domain-containing protein [Cyclobacteriaceae bacterium]|nr:DUF4199 domain-containing protein [Cyclobacteriaceae bacterium]
MKKIIFIYGLIAGAIIGGMLLITMPLYNSGTLKFDNGEILGYSTMTIAFITIFFGIKSYRDSELKGVISFGKAVQIGLLITLVAAVIYALCWEISYRQIGGTFTAKMAEHTMAKMRAEGATEEQLTEALAKWKSFGEMYKNPIIRFGITILEPSPVGIVLTLVSAALLRRKEFLPATETVTTNSSAS